MLDKATPASVAADCDRNVRRSGFRSDSPMLVSREMGIADNPTFRSLPWCSLIQTGPLQANARVASWYVSITRKRGEKTP